MSSPVKIVDRGAIVFSGISGVTAGELSNGEICSSCVLTENVVQAHNKMHVDHRIIVMTFRIQKHPFVHKVKSHYKQNTQASCSGKISYVYS